MHRLDFPEIVTFAFLLLLLTMSTRAAIRSLVSRLAGDEAALLIGGGRLAELFSAKLRAHPEYRVKVIGVLSDHHQAKARSFHPLPVLGSPGELEQVAHMHHVRRVILSPSKIDEGSDLEELLRRCRVLQLKVSLLPKLSDMLGSAVEIDDVEGITVLGLNPPWLSRSSRALKRAMDVVLATVSLVPLAPLIALIAAAIKLDSAGSMLFVQTRVGRWVRATGFRGVLPGHDVDHPPDLQRRARVL